MKDNEKDTALYLRLSMADGDLGKDSKDESNSIENQRQLLLSYINDRDDLSGCVREYIDDGYTGTNFKRPGFEKMIKDAGKGEIGTILVKDLSRLGRDYIGVGDYIEQIFPMMGVRFIAVNNNFDSGAYLGVTMGLDLALSNLVNTLYSRDVSKKIRSSMEVKWKQGVATSRIVPFGYLWDKKSKNRWVIDPVASKYVRMIFDAALEGCDTSQIASRMNYRKIPTPGIYARKLGKGVVDTAVSPESEQLWEPRIVWGILRKYEYTGALVMGRRKRISLGDGCIRSVPKEDSIITENAHEAIVTHEEFDKAQGAIRTVKPPAYKTRQDYPLKGVVRCGNCKRMMTFCDRYGENAFVCTHKRNVGGYSSCYGGFYKEGIVNSRVLYAIRQVTGMAKFLDDTVKRQKLDNVLRLEFADAEKMKGEVEVLKAESIRQYEAYADGIISRNDYISKKKEITDKIHALEEQIQKTDIILKEQSDSQAEVKEVADQYNTITQEKELKELVDAFVETVYLYDANRIEVVFKCEDAAVAVMERCVANAEDGVLDYPYGLEGDKTDEGN